MNDKITNTIFLKQQIINELESLKIKIMKSATEDVRFRIETRHWYGYGTDIHFGKERDILPISKDAMKLLIDEAIKKEKERIDKLIDMEIEQKLKGEVIRNEKVKKAKTKKIK